MVFCCNRVFWTGSNTTGHESWGDNGGRGDMDSMAKKYPAAPGGFFSDFFTYLTDT